MNKRTKKEKIFRVIYFGILIGLIALFFTSCGKKDGENFVKLEVYKTGSNTICFKAIFLSEVPDSLEIGFSARLNDGYTSWALVSCEVPLVNESRCVLLNSPTPITLYKDEAYIEYIIAKSGRKFQFKTR
jgi:hypothetical protein